MSSADEDLLNADHAPASFNHQPTALSQCINPALTSAFEEGRHVKCPPATWHRVKNRRNYLTPRSLPDFLLSATFYSRPHSILGEVIPIRATMPDGPIMRWEPCQLVVNGQYNELAWTADGATEYRPGFQVCHVAVRVMSSFYNTGGNPCLDIRWCKNNYITCGNVMSPDGGCTWWYVLAVKSPIFKELMEIVQRNDHFKRAVVEGRRPILVFNDIVWAKGSGSNATELQTLSLKNDSNHQRSSVTYMGDYYDLPSSYPARALASLKNPSSSTIDLTGSDDERKVTKKQEEQHWSETEVEDCGESESEVETEEVEELELEEEEEEKMPSTQ
jgi:hypothetical protein